MATRRSAKKTPRPLDRAGPAMRDLTEAVRSPSAAHVAWLCLTEIVTATRLAAFRDDLAHREDLAARRMTRLLRDFDSQTRALQRSRV